MPGSVGFFKSEMPAQQMCFCCFFSTAGLAWGMFLVLLCQTYQNSYTWKYPCLFFASVVIIVCLLSIVVSITGMFYKDMCCFQKNFLTCDFETYTVNEEPVDSSNERATDSVNNIYEEIPLNNRSISVPDTYSDVAKLAAPIHLQQYCTVTGQHEDTLESQHLYMTPVGEYSTNRLKNNIINAKVRATKNISPQKTIAWRYAPGMPTRYFADPPLMTSSPKEATNERLQHQGRELSNAMSNPEYMSTEQLKNSNVVQIYQNVPFTNSLGASRSIPPELASSGTTSGRNFSLKTTNENAAVQEAKPIGKFPHLNMKKLAQNASDKGLRVYRKCSPKRLNLETIPEIAIPEEVDAGDCSLIYANQNAIDGNIIPKALNVSSSSLPGNVTENVIDRNNIPENSSNFGTTSSIYVNVVPQSRNNNSND